MFSIVMGHITDQDLGKPVNLSHHAVDLTVLWPSNWNVGQSPCEEMASRAQGANVISNVLAGVPQEHRQNVFYALSGVALQSARNVDRDLPEDLIIQVRQVAQIYVEGGLDGVAKHLGLKVPENDRGSPTAH